MSRDVQMGKLVVQLCGFHDLDMTDRELVCNRRTGNHSGVFNQSRITID